MQSSPTRVLLIDDDEDSFVIMRDLLSAKSGDAMHLDWASSFEDGATQLEKAEHDVYLVDYRLGSGSGLDLLEVAKDQRPRLPVIILTSQQDPELDREVMKAGAVDYLVKGDTDADHLERTIRYAVERQRLVLDLERERYLLHTLMENLPDLIYFKDLDGRFMRVSRTLAEKLGLCSPEEAKGKGDSDFFPADFTAIAAADERRIMETGNPLIGKEERPQWPDGTSTWSSTNKAVLRDDHGHVVGTFGMSRDITETKRAAEAWREAKEAAEAANQAKSDFLANMSHEMRTPLNAVIGMTELVLDTKLSDSQKEYLRMVKESGESLLTQVNDLLDFSRIEAGKIDLVPETFIVREALGDTMKSLGVRAATKNVELVCDIDGSVPEVLVGDVGRLRQIVINLVGNAIKFTEVGEVVLTVKSKTLEDEATMLQFVVRDTGIGIPENKRPEIFKPFEQVDASSTRAHGGAGLGLSIASRLVELMGGRMWLESELGVGSKFFFTAHFGVGQASNAISERAVVLRGTRVLIVDDNATNRLLLRELLTTWGLDPVDVADAKQAFAELAAGALSNRPFQVLLSDVNMPEEDGFSLIERVRDSQHICDTIIMMLTSGTRSGDLQRCEQLRVAAHLIKPVKQSELFDALALSLGLNVAEDELERKHDEPRTKPLRILLAEDSVVNQKLAIGILTRHHHTVTVASNGREAVDFAAKGGHELVLMDIQMPELDGLAATREIRAAEEGTSRHLPIIAMTAHAMKGDREECLRAGMDAYIAKPIRTVALYRTIQRVMGGPVLPSVVQTSSLRPMEGVIDWQVAMRTVQGDYDLLCELIESFLTEGPQLVSRIQAALNNEDANELRIASHTIKSSFRYFGADEAQQLALDIETKARREDVPGSAKSVSQLHDLWPMVEIALRSMPAKSVLAPS